jgi:hypothetical protein
MSSQLNQSWLNHELHSSAGSESTAGKRWQPFLAPYFGER